MPAAFDAPDLIEHAGLVPAFRLAERCGLPALAAEKVKLTGAGNGAGTAADAKALPIVGGMVARADSSDDLDVLCQCALPRLFGGVRAPFTLGARATRGPCTPTHILDADVHLVAVACRGSGGGKHKPSCRRASPSTAIARC